jgi:CRISPR system Cascade subunit CasE
MNMLGSPNTSVGSALYLSRLLLAVRNRSVQADLADCYAMHRQLLLAFPNVGGLPDARDHFGVLYRVEAASNRVDLLIQSSTAPDWSRLPDGYFRDSSIAIKRVDPLYAVITEGQHLVFRLRANPTKRISDRNTTQDERWRGKRVDLRREEDQLKWLDEKGKQSGFALLAVRTQAGHNPIADVRATGTADRVISRSHHLTFASVTFEGRLRVTDPDAFRQALWQGIGSGKAFGFGLLSIAPFPE